MNNSNGAVDALKRLLEQVMESAERVNDFETPTVGI
jgi:hypothetical protein